MRAKESREMYLEVIYRLENRNDVVRSVDIAKELDYSKPSVSKAMGVLKKFGYIEHSPYGEIILTDEGREKAKGIYQSHRLLTDFLVEVLNIDSTVAETNACRMEHIVTDDLLTAIDNYMESRKSR